MAATPSGVSTFSTTTTRARAVAEHAGDFGGALGDRASCFAVPPFAEMHAGRRDAIEEGGGGRSFGRFRFGENHVVGGLTRPIGRFRTYLHLGGSYSTLKPADLSGLSWRGATRRAANFAPLCPSRQQKLLCMLGGAPM
eukprot:5307221-Prymnesium_polylepis.1